MKRPHSLSRPTARCGFSLLELLVAILIISLLIGLVGVGLQRSREVARTAVCGSNLRQIGTQLQVYLNDSRGVMPSFNNRVLTTDAGPAIDTDLFEPGVGDAVMKCPSDDRRVYEDSGTSYYWNFSLNGQKVDTMFSLFGGRDQNKIPLLSDKEGWHPELAPRVNILYADSHVGQQINFSVSLP